MNGVQANAMNLGTTEEDKVFRPGIEIPKKKEGDWKESQSHISFLKLAD